jgi:hypothetical protein
MGFRSLPYLRRGMTLDRRSLQRRLAAHFQWGRVLAEGEGLLVAWGHGIPMRALAALALLALALAMPSASALVMPSPPITCIPESPLCQPPQVMCPHLGGTFGWCAQPGVADVDGDGTPDQLNVTFVVGDWYGPRVGAQAGAGALPDSDAVPTMDAGLGAGGDTCRRNLVLPATPPDGTPDAPCDASAEFDGGL